MIVQTIKAKKDLSCFTGSNPIITIVCSLHGNEYTPSYTGFLLYNYLKDYPHDHFEFKIINFANESGLIAGTRDTRSNFTYDLNRSFHHLNSDDLATITSIVNESAVVIDIHSSPDCIESFLLDVDDQLPKYLDILGEIPNMTRYSGAQTLKNYVKDFNALGFTLELKGIDSVNMQSGEEGFNLVMILISKLNKYYSLLTYSFQFPEYNIQYINRAPRLTPYQFSKSGIIIKPKKAGADIQTDDIICQILNIKTNKLEAIRYYGPPARIMYWDTTGYYNPEKILMTYQEYK